MLIGTAFCVYDLQDTIQPSTNLMASTRGMLWLAVITLALGAASARDITALKVVSQRALKQAGE